MLLFFFENHFIDFFNKEKLLIWRCFSFFFGYGKSINSRVLLVKKSVMAATVFTVARGLLFKHPSNFYICGPSQSGKTEFVKKLIEHKELMFDIPPQQFVRCY